MEMQKNNRLLEVFFLLLKGEAISIKSVAEQYGVSRKSISRDISEIRDFLSEHRDLLNNAELTYSYKTKTYLLSNDEFLKNKELFAIVKILLGCRALNKNEILNIVSKLKKFTTISDRTMMDNLIHKEIFHYHEVKSDCKSVIENLWRVIQAIENKNIITISYFKMNREEVKHKIIPASIMFCEYYFYLIAYKTEDDMKRPIHFRVDRITSVMNHRESFSNEFSFDEGELREKNQFMFPGENIKIKFEFTGPSVQAVLDRLPTARIIEKNGNINIVEAEVNYGRGLIMYLMSQGSWLKILEPLSLIDNIKMECENILNNYDRCQI